MDAQTQALLSSVIVVAGGWVQAWLHALKGFPDPLANFASVVAAVALCAWANWGHPFDFVWGANALLMIGAIKGFSAYSAEAKAAPAPNSK